MPCVSFGPSETAPRKNAAMTAAALYRSGVPLVAGAALWRPSTAAATMFLFLAICKRPAVFGHFCQNGLLTFVTNALTQPA